MSWFRNVCAPVHVDFVGFIGDLALAFLSLAVPTGIPTSHLYIFKDFIYLFLEKGGRREKERERNINVCRPLLGIWPATQARALTGNQTHDPLVRKLALKPLSHTSHGVT